MIQAVALETDTFGILSTDPPFHCAQGFNVNFKLSSLLQASPN